MNRLRFDLKTRPPIAEREDKEPCGICKRQISRYTCPTCNLPYCSLTCFRSEVHAQCSETFYRKEIEFDIRTAPSKSMDERKKMLELLRKFEEESAQGPDESNETEDDLAAKLEGLNIDTADPEALWSILSPAQRDSFMKAMQDPSSELAQQLLSSTEMQGGRRKPWWESPWFDLDGDPKDSGEFGTPPHMMSIPQNLCSPEKNPVSNHLLVYNILALCLAYSYVTRKLYISPLSALNSTDPDRAVARDLLSQLTPFLTDRKSTLVLSSIDNLVTYTWSRLEVLSDQPSNKSFSLLLTDAAFLMQPKSVTIITDDESDSQPSRMALLAISDIASLFISGSTKDKHVSHKLNFYAAHLCVQKPDVLRLVAGQARATALEMKAQA